MTHCPVCGSDKITVDIGEVYCSRCKDHISKTVTERIAELERRVDVVLKEAGKMRKKLNQDGFTRRKVWVRFYSDPALKVPSVLEVFNAEPKITKTPLQDIRECDLIVPDKEKP